MNKLAQRNFAGMMFAILLVTGLFVAGFYFGGEGDKITGAPVINTVADAQAKVRDGITVYTWGSNRFSTDKPTGKPYTEIRRVGTSKNWRAVSVDGTGVPYAAHALGDSNINNFVSQGHDNLGTFNAQQTWGSLERDMTRLGHGPGELDSNIFFTSGTVQPTRAALEAQRASNQRVIDSDTALPADKDAARQRIREINALLAGQPAPAAPAPGTIFPPTTDIPVGAFQVVSTDPLAPGILYYKEEGGKIWESSDEGKTWKVRDDQTRTLAQLRTDFASRADVRVSSVVAAPVRQPARKPPVAPTALALDQTPLNSVLADILRVGALTSGTVTIPGYGTIRRDGTDWKNAQGQVITITGSGTSFALTITQTTGTGTAATATSTSVSYVGGNQVVNTQTTRAGTVTAAKRTIDYGGGLIATVQSTTGAILDTTPVTLTSGTSTAQITQSVLSHITTTIPAEMQNAFLTGIATNFQAGGTVTVEDIGIRITGSQGNTLVSSGTTPAGQAQVTVQSFIQPDRTKPQILVAVTQTIDYGGGMVVTQEHVVQDGAIQGGLAGSTGSTVTIALTTTVTGQPPSTTTVEMNGQQFAQLGIFPAMPDADRNTRIQLLNHLSVQGLTDLSGQGQFDANHGFVVPGIIEDTRYWVSGNNRLIAQDWDSATGSAVVSVITGTGAATTEVVYDGSGGLNIQVVDADGNLLIQSDGSVTGVDTADTDYVTYRINPDGTYTANRVEPNDAGTALVTLPPENFDAAGFVTTVTSTGYPPVTIQYRDERGKPCKEGDTACREGSLRRANYAYVDAAGNPIVCDNPACEEAVAAAERARARTSLTVDIQAALAVGSRTRSLVDILGLDDTPWRRQMDEFFIESTLGQVISGRWEESLCNAYVDRDYQSVLILDTGEGTFGSVGAHVEGRASESVLYFDEATQTEKQEFLYAITFEVISPSDGQNMTFNIQLIEAGVSKDVKPKSVYLFVRADDPTIPQNFIVNPGGSASATAGAMQVLYSNNTYKTICLEFVHEITSAAAGGIEPVTVRNLCNTIASPIAGKV